MVRSTRDLGFGSDADRWSVSKDHVASKWPRSGSELRALLHRCCVTVPLDSKKILSSIVLAGQCMISVTCPCKCGFTTHSLRAVRSSHETTLNPDRGSRSSESGFSARVESLVNIKYFLPFILDLIVFLKNKFMLSSQWFLCYTNSSLILFLLIKQHLDSMRE